MSGDCSATGACSPLRTEQGHAVTFQSFIREPKPEERHLAGLQLGHADQGECPLRAQLVRLSRRLYLPYAWPAPAGTGREPWENPSIPAGYTYFAQFVAHDTVLSSAPTSALRSGRPPVSNGRAAPLELQTLYGSGFDGCMTRLTDAERTQLQPSKLAVGQIRLGSVVDGRCPFRDIPRSQSRHATAERKGLGVVSIPDDRNDNNVFVAQTTMLFTLLHNCLVDLLHAQRGHPEKPSQSYFAALYEDAREICTVVYRRIVRNDLLRRLLHPRVYALYASDRPFYFDDRAAAGVTYEYTQALRFGHAMVRPHYRVNDVVRHREELIDALLTTSRGRPWRLPLDESWPIQWSKFYGIAGSTPNLSRRLAPSFSTDLVSGLVFDSIDATQCVGLAYRDLVNSAGSPTWSVDGLIAEIAARMPSLVQSSRLLVDGEYRRDVLDQWLAQRREATGLTPADIDAVSSDPPLFLFVLLEAAHEAGGEHLGLLGSVIIGEPLFKLLDQPRASGGKTSRAEELAAKVTDMPGLIEFVRAHAGLEEELIPFV